MLGYAAKAWRAPAWGTLLGLLAIGLALGCSQEGTEKASAPGTASQPETLPVPAQSATAPETPAPGAAQSGAAEHPDAAADAQQAAEPQGGPLLIPAGPRASSAPETASDQKESPLIPRKVLFGNPDKARARLSADGRWLSYLAPVGGVLNVWVGPREHPDQAKPVTKDTKRGIRTYLWSYSPQYLLYMQDVDGDENWHIYSVDVEKGQTTDLTPLAGVQAQIDTVSEKFPDEILIGLNNRNPQLHDLYRVNIITGERKLLQENPGFAALLADDDYRVRLALTFTPEGGQELLKPDEKQGWSTFLKVGPLDALTTNPLGFDKTAEKLYLVDSRDRNTSALTTVDLKTGDQKVLAENPKADVGGVLIHPTEKNVQAVSFTYERQKWEVLDPAVEDDFKYLRTVEDGEIQITSRTLDDHHWTVAYIVDDGPLQFYRYDREAKQAHFLFSSQSALEQYDLAKMHPVIIPARDGLKLVSYLTLPRDADPQATGRPDRPLPMVLDVHGGPWARDDWGYNPEHQWLADRGYAVLAVNYRGSTGLGKGFVNAANGQWAGQMHDDLLDAVDWAVREKIARKDKIAIMGGSYGGYAALVGLTFTPEVFACGVDIVGPSSLVTLLQNVPPYWAPFMPVMKERVGDYTTEEGRKLLMERSPLSRVDRIQRPLLIGQGANDPRVKQQEADQIVAAMRERKIPVTYVLFPDEGHGFARPDNRLSFNAVVEAFLAGWLGGRYQPVGDDFQGSTIQVPTGADQVPGLDDALEAK